MGSVSRTRLIATYGILAGALVAAGADGAGAFEAAAVGAKAPVAATRAPETGLMALPRLLSSADADLYRRLFEVQEGADWHGADRLIAKLKDRLLLGHVLGQRYLHTEYRSSYKELRAWMADYADHPDAARVYKLALARRPKNTKAPPPPTNLPKLVIAAEAASYAEMLDELDIEAQVRADDGLPKPEPRTRLSREDRQELDRHERQIAVLIRRGNPKAAHKHLESPNVQRLLGKVPYDRARALVAQGYYGAGDNEAAIELAGAAAKRSGVAVPEAHWTAGLAAWRLGLYGEAARSFEALAQQTSASPWLVSASAFWAARSHLMNRQPQNHSRLLMVAASYPKTFYGLLARHILGIPAYFQWQTPALEEKAIEALTRIPAGRRSIALLDMGEDRRAERELFAVAAQGQTEFARLILAFAGRAGLPALAVKLDTLLFPNGGGFDGAAYPIPKWAPSDGFRVDRALIYALIRQESGFNPRAKSRAGAAGLMQLMPSTASFVAGDPAYRKAKLANLYTPEVNITLGQRYVEMLLEDDNIKGDLFMLAAAWNGGPGNLNKWLKRTDFQNDPLLFIESIPSRETRVFIERVLTNLWIYRHRFGQPSPSLVALAEGQWPVYAALDPEAVFVAEASDDRR